MIPAPQPAEDHTTRTVLQLALPVILENLLRTAVYFSDTLMIGWLHDPAVLVLRPAPPSLTITQSIRKVAACHAPSF